MDWRGTERVDWSNEEAGGVACGYRVQAAIEVGQNLDRISTATEDVLIHLDLCDTSFKCLVHSFVEALLHFSASLSHLQSQLFRHGLSRVMVRCGGAKSCEKCMTKNDEGERKSVNATV